MIPRHQPKGPNRGTEYVELTPKEKLKLLNAHCLSSWSSLADKKWCLHCEKEFTGASTRIYRKDGELWVECGTPACDGSPIDFADFPWWDSKHPLTKAHEKAAEDSSIEEPTKKPRKKKR